MSEDKFTVRMDAYVSVGFADDAERDEILKMIDPVLDETPASEISRTCYPNEIRIYFDDLDDIHKLSILTSKLSGVLHKNEIQNNA